MILGSWYVDVSSSKRVDGMTDRQTAFQLYIYRYTDNQRNANDYFSVFLIGGIVWL